MLLVPVLLGLAAVPATAHAVLLDTDPGDGAALDKAPEAITLEFNEPVELPANAIEVFDADGERVDEDDAAHGAQRSQVRAGLPAQGDPEQGDGVQGDAAQGDGVYIVSWRVISADTHAVSGSFVFTVGEADASEIDAAEFAGDGDEQAGAASSVARAVMYAGSLLAVGGAVFLLFVAGPVHSRVPAQGSARSSRVVVLASAGLAAAATAVGIPLQAAEGSGQGPAGLVDPVALLQVLDGPLGVASGVRLAGLLVLVAGVLALPARRGMPAALLGGLAMLGSFLASGHTITSEPRSVVLASNLVHTSAAAVWFGGLVLLALTLRQRKAADDAEGGALLVARFSSVALVSVLAVAAAGTALAWVELRGLAPLVTSTYGLTLLAKVGLVAAVLAVAAYNRNRLVPAIRRHSGRAWQRLQRTVRVEVLGILGVVALTGVLVGTTPPRVAAEAGEPATATEALGPDHEITVTVDPGEAGHNHVEVHAHENHAGEHDEHDHDEHDHDEHTGEHGHAGSDLGDEVTASFANDEAGIEPITRELDQGEPGHYTHAGTEMSVPGTWTIRVQARVSEFERLTTEVTVEVQ